jgi:zinc/manganese transport system permease protein
VVLAFGLGLAVLFIHLYPGRTATSFALLTGQIVGMGYSGLAILAVVSVLVAAVLAFCYRPLLFGTVDPELAAARGVPGARWALCSRRWSVWSRPKECRLSGRCW